MPLLLKFLPEIYVCMPSAGAAIKVTSISTHEEKYPKALNRMFCISYSTPLF